MAPSPTSSPLTELSDALAAAVEKAGASLVTVRARRRIPATGIAWTADGTILTADHVVEFDEGITVGLPDGTDVAASLAGRDPGSDLAVLRLDAALTAAEPAPAESGRVGSIVLALGRPSADGPQASLGVVSATGGAWRTAHGAQVEGYLRSDTTFFPGFSGGPLVDAAGRVVGINSSHLGRGAGLTIPYAAAAKVVEALLAHGKVRRGYLGVGTQQVKLPSPIAARLDGQDSGLLVMSVEPDTAADRAGIGIGDILVALAGTPIATTEDLQAQLTGDRVGAATPAKVLRGGEPVELTITIGERQ